MHKPQYSDPLGGQLPALEQSIIKFRAMQMMLIMFYAEELKRSAIGSALSTRKFCAILKSHKTLTSQPTDTRGGPKITFDTLESDGIISNEEKKEIIDLIGFRNKVAHELHTLTADIKTSRMNRVFLWNADFNYNAAERLKFYLHEIPERLAKNGYAVQISLNNLLFQSAERTFASEINRLRAKIKRLAAEREKKISKLNAELSLENTELQGEFHPSHPLCQYDNGRLTKRGTEICYRLFDMGKSAMAVAHLTGLSLNATRKRRKQWQEAGGINRQKADIGLLPKRKFSHRRHELI